jgi:multiple sugar transport system permease protein
MHPITPPRTVLQSSLQRLWPVLARIGGVLLAMLLASPLALLVGNALRSPVAPPPTRVELWPQSPSLDALREAFSLVPLGTGLMNSLFVLVVAVPLTLAVASAAAFALTQMPRRRQAAWIIFLLLAASIPLTAIWIPRFVLFSNLGLVGTYVPLIAPALTGGSPLFVLLYFAAMRRVPADLVDSARLEGLGAVAIWWRIALPLVRPTSFAVGVLAAVLFWGNFMEALLYLHEERDLTAPLMLHAIELLGPTQWPVLLAGALAVTLPVLVLFLVLQRHLLGDARRWGWFGR